MTKHKYEHTNLQVRSPFRKTFNLFLLLTLAIALNTCKDIITNASPATQEELIFDGKQMPIGWFQASDPDLVKLDNQWYMFFTSLTFIQNPTREKLHILAARLPVGEGIDSDVSSWAIIEDNEGEVLPIISPGTGQDDWDREGTETANYVRGYDNSANEWVERIYYLGWKFLPGDDGILYTEDDLREYQIGYAERNGSAWVKHPFNPVLTGTHSWEILLGQSFIGDQAVYYEPGTGPNGEGGTWHMWYNAGSNTPDFVFVIGHATSSDGVSWLEANREIMPQAGPYATAVLPSGPYYCDMEKLDGLYHFLGFIPNDQDPSLHGLYVTSSTTPDGNNSTADFTDWHLLVKEKNGTFWHDSVQDPDESNGLFGSTLKQDGDKLWLYYHGVSYRNDTYWASIGRILVTDYPP